MTRRALRRIRLIGAALLAVLVGLTWMKAPWTDRLQAAVFDAHQTLAPRQVRELSATIVEIDQKSLLALGQWPWPRTLLAQLVLRIHQAQPAALALNILMPEPDALSPEQLLGRTPIDDMQLASALRAVPANDSVLAAALAQARAVLVVAGTPEPTDMLLRAPPVMLAGDVAEPGHRGSALRSLTRYGGALTSLPQLDAVAAGRGLISADLTRGVLRRIPLVANIGGTPVPTLAAEMLRVASGVPALRLTLADGAVASVSIGRLQVPTEPDAAVRIYFSTHRDDRFVSAVDVLRGKVDAAALKGQLVLVGLTSVGLMQYQDTPIGERMSGSEIQAQLIENLIDGSLLRRPGWAVPVEALWLLSAGALLLWATPRWKVAQSALTLLGCIVLPVLIGVLLFRSHRLLFDAATPALGLMLLYATLLALSLSDSARQRKSLEGLVLRQRERSARLAGELQAAQRIQNQALPPADLLRGDARVELFATLNPAIEVGGDMYDYFLLDADRLFLLLGDVAGKGLSASIFMAVSKALTKSAMLRDPAADIGAVMRVANREVSRDNAESLFVSVFAAILDLRSGKLDYCNAGHENPFVLGGAGSAWRRIADGDGPPLCAVADYDYRAASRQLARGDVLCLMTDGVTEALDLHGRLYGHERVEALLSFASGGSARAVVEALHRDVQAFVAGAPAADDLTILALRWNGAGSSGIAPA